LADIGLLYTGVFVGFLGVGIVIAIVLFDRFLIRHYLPRLGISNFLEEQLGEWIRDARRRGVVPDQATIAGLAEQFLTKRNELGTIFGQYVLSAFVIVVVAILLLAQVITAEAGLPILTAVAGFAIGKASTGARSLLPTSKQRQEG